MKHLALLILMMGSFAFAQKHSPPMPQQLPKYTVGSGGKYALTLGKDETEVTLGFIESTGSKLVFEVKMKSLSDSASLNVQMTQQFHLALEGGKVKIVKGIMKIPMIKEPQILPPEFLGGYDGVQVSSFLIGSKSDLSGKKIGVENVTTPAGAYAATHYRQTENGQTIDYWLADSAKPLGLVKIQSTGANASQNYKMVFKGAVSGVTADINASEAVPLSEAGRMVLPLLTPGMGHL